MEQIFEFFNELLGTENWPARWVCGRWTPFHGWMYIVADILIWAAYFTIPIILIKFIRQKKNIPLTGVFLLFGAFILMCGLTHLLDALMFYWPAYRLSSLLRMATAIISWFTVFALFKVMPQALKLKTSKEFEAELEERKRMESELRLSESRFKALLDSAPEAILVLDKSLKIVSGNKNFSALFNKSLTHVSQIEITSLFEENQAEVIQDQITQSAEGKTTVISQVKVNSQLKNNQFVEIRVSKIGIDDAVNFMLLIRDISAQIEHEESLKIAKERAEQNAQLKQEFLANMSHEIRTPMNSIIGFSRMILTRDIDTELKEIAEIIYESTEDLLVIVNDILDFSKMESGKMKLEPRNFLVREKLNRIQKMFRLKAEEKGLNFSLKVNNSVPEALFGDEVRFGQVLNNLVSNAIKFTNKGSVNITVDATSINEKSCNLEIKVIDTGSGIPDKKLNDVFESFVQIEGRLDRTQGGTGLGLAIVKKIAKLLGGEIHVESKMGEGTIFTINLPFEIGDVKKASTYMITKDTEAINLSGVKVLMAEDNRNNQILVKKICKDWKVDLTIVSNGQEAVDAVKQDDYHLILMDIQMPVMDGEMATQIINEMPDKNHIPIVALTAHVLEKEVSRLQNLGMKGYLFKPFKPIDLVQTINEFNISKDI